ncbi:WhiB family transcriptional regulator [Rhodococcus sp. 14C212]|uniref:WhiB family transcriptional regulator n=1 Tax=Rhodococcus sp. 14C212 TaxID=2711209 RepID=UPI0013EB8DAF|nr:WhiB family transcriptional regulator [Rhodococcus sp. 14C212]NGP06279.1 WhiB family transcriptional regulator [Rhodococcus sp. 14C212]
MTLPAFALSPTAVPDARDGHSWRLHARCRFVGPDTFYAPEDETWGERQRRERAARDICAACPVRLPCRDDAVKNKEQHGIWGGLTERERRGLRYVRWLPDGSATRGAATPAAG